MKYREVNRPAKVGDWIKVTAHCDVYGIEAYVNESYAGLAVVMIGGKKWWIPEESYVVLESKYREVNRPAKDGEWIKTPWGYNQAVVVTSYGDARVDLLDGNSVWLPPSKYVVMEPVVDCKPRPTKAENYLAIAKAVSERSTCTRRQYGAVIVQNDEIIATGYNGAPRGMENCCDTGWCGRSDHNHNDGDYSTCPAVHAEANAIISAARRDMIGATLYLYGSQDGKTIAAEPCPICKGLIANAGITDVVCSEEETSHGPKNN